MQGFHLLFLHVQQPVCNVNKFLSKRRLCTILIGYITNMHYFLQNEGVILKMGSWISLRNKRNAHILYRDIGGFLEVTLLWIHPIET